MNTNLKTDFTVDKETNTVYVQREFSAGLSLVWDAYTKAEILDQWWAPNPWISKTKSMEFKVGGKRLYAMCSPEGEEHWSFAEYTSITPKSNFQFKDGFCDKEGNINEELPRSKWNIDFEEMGEGTLVKVEIKHEKLSDLETIIEMGFKEGFMAVLEQLEELFLSKK
ncbi:MAG: SRPBCC family protein [Bacteroidota bacterium]